MSTRITASKQPHDHRVYLHVWNNGAFCEAMTFVQKQEGEYVAPAVKLTIEEAQILMDSLWDCGIRPTEGSGSAGCMRATEKHLEDMRKIVSKKLNIELK